MLSSILLLLAVQASVEAPTVEDRSTVETPAPEKGTIVLYRQGSIMGAALACPIRWKGYELVELGRSKYAEWVVPAGSYILTNNTASVEVNVAPGQTKYVRCQIKTGFLTGRADLQIVDRENFVEHAAEFERKAIINPLER